MRTASHYRVSLHTIGCVGIHEQRNLNPRSRGSRRHIAIDIFRDGSRHCVDCCAKPLRDTRPREILLEVCRVSPRCPLSRTDSEARRNVSNGRRFEIEGAFAEDFREKFLRYQSAALYWDTIAAGCVRRTDVPGQEHLQCARVTSGAQLGGSRVTERELMRKTGGTADQTVVRASWGCSSRAFCPRGASGCLGA